MKWLLENIVGIISIIVGGFIAYHVYFLSEKLGLRGKLVHREGVRRRVEPIFEKIHKGGRRKVELINVKKYFGHYPNTNEHNKDGYTYLGAELKELRFDGIEFFCAVREAYKNVEGKIFLQGGNGMVQQSQNIFEVGIVPYEWIEYVDAQGDEFSYKPQFFTQFNGIDKSPYKYLTYYEKSDTYLEGNDPIEMQWRKVKIEK